METPRLDNSDAYRGRRDVREISSDSWSVDNIVEGQLVDERTGLQQ
jgi:hypothetical protein